MQAGARGDRELLRLQLAANSTRLGTIGVHRVGIVLQEVRRGGGTGREGGGRGGGVYQYAAVMQVSGKGTRWGSMQAEISCPWLTFAGHVDGAGCLYDTCLRHRYGKMALP
jgi:hypothetical protein